MTTTSPWRRAHKICRPQNKSRWRKSRFLRKKIKTQRTASRWWCVVLSRWQLFGGCCCRDSRVNVPSFFLFFFWPICPSPGGPASSIHNGTNYIILLATESFVLQYVQDPVLSFFSFSSGDLKRKKKKKKIIRKDEPTVTGFIRRNNSVTCSGPAAATTLLLSPPPYLLIYKIDLRYLIC